jgi:hypothetical protein
VFNVVVHSGRTKDFTVTIKTASGGYLQLAATDMVRLKVGRGSQTTPTLDILSGTATANSSSVTIDQRGDGSATHCQVTVRLAQGDTSSLLGEYQAEVLVVDDSETAPADAVKAAEYGLINVIASMAGNVDLTT